MGFDARPFHLAKPQGMSVQIEKKVTDGLNHRILLERETAGSSRTSVGARRVEPSGRCR